jgi:hypothetical protein
MSETRSIPTAVPLWTQTAVCLVLACAVAAGFALVDVAARSDTINDWLVERQLTKWKATNSKFQYNRGYIDFEGRLLYGEVPEADYSDGGVYFMGSSTVKNSILFWELPSDQRRLIHNYALSGSGPAEWNLFLHYLIEHNHLLEAGGEKTTIIFGLYFVDFYGAFELNEGLVKSMFTRHGLYDFSPQEIRPAHIPKAERFLLAEKARCANFLHFALGHMAFRDKPALTEQQKKQYRQIYADLPMPDYTERFADFSNLVDYLRSKKVRVAAYFVPMGSWFRGGYGELKMADEFHAQAEAFCQKNQIPVLNVPDLVPDEEFFDSGHANYKGQKRMHPRLIEFALEQLYESGVLPRPADDAQEQPAGAPDASATPPK